VGGAACEAKHGGLDCRRRSTRPVCLLAAAAAHVVGGVGQRLGRVHRRRWRWCGRASHRPSQPRAPRAGTSPKATEARPTNPRAMPSSLPRPGFRCCRCRRRCCRSRSSNLALRSGRRQATTASRSLDDARRPAEAATAAASRKHGARGGHVRRSMTAGSDPSSPAGRAQAGVVGRREAGSKAGRTAEEWAGGQTSPVAAAGGATSLRCCHRRPSSASWTRRASLRSEATTTLRLSSPEVPRHATALQLRVTAVPAAAADGTSASPAAATRRCTPTGCRSHPAPLVERRGARVGSGSRKARSRRVGRQSSGAVGRGTSG